MVDRRDENLTDQPDDDGDWEALIPDELRDAYDVLAGSPLVPIAQAPFGQIGAPIRYATEKR